MRPLACLWRRFRHALRPVEKTAAERRLESAVEENIKAAQRGASAARNLEIVAGEAAVLVRKSRHA